MKTKISLEEFLSEEANETFLCTLEKVADDDTKIKLTPFINEQEGCGCSSALILSKDLIESVSPTENSHLCCGKKHKVVEVFFKEGASIKVEDILKSTIEKASKKKAANSDHHINKQLPYHPFTYPTEGMIQPFGFRQPHLRNLTLGCGLNAFASGACASGCQCLDINNNTYCCPDSCCL
jgi:hypothetical protein